jgi:hypothetical protein
MRKTEEAKVADKIAKMLDSASLDLDRVGVELARIQPTLSYNRLILIAESAIEEKENSGVRINHYPLF